MINNKPNIHFWNRILSFCDALDEDDQSLVSVQGFLSGIDEGFSDVFDPAEHFSEYVTLHLCRSMANFLDGLAPPAEKD